MLLLLSPPIPTYNLPPLSLLTSPSLPEVRSARFSSPLPHPSRPPLMTFPPAFPPVFPRKKRGNPSPLLSHSFLSRLKTSVPSPVAPSLLSATFPSPPFYLIPSFSSSLFLNLTLCDSYSFPSLSSPSHSSLPRPPSLFLTCPFPFPCVLLPPSFLSISSGFPSLPCAPSSPLLSSSFLPAPLPPFFLLNFPSLPLSSPPCSSSLSPSLCPPLLSLLTLVAVKCHGQSWVAGSANFSPLLVSRLDVWRSIPITPLYVLSPQLSGRPSRYSFSPLLLFPQLSPLPPPSFPLLTPSLFPHVVDFPPSLLSSSASLSVPAASHLPLPACRSRKSSFASRFPPPVPALCLALRQSRDCASRLSVNLPAPPCGKTWSRAASQSRSRASCRTAFPSAERCELSLLFHGPSLLVFLTCSPPPPSTSRPAKSFSEAAQ
ncbi:hypothetical protein C7M84_016694 [Penaeus vannamei]|uniref:Uncharacterized protein n=1 Tax=Penaeus vannamei TaxID=6689 RepID=A0A3R7PG14_PENVA|nr:hypothetical protein C7M84_016694 [Penaeus vannamei]